MVEPIEVAKAFLRRNGMVKFMGQRAISGEDGSTMWFFRGAVIPNKKAIRCLIRQEADGRMHSPVIVNRSEKNRLTKPRIEEPAKKKE